jgi:hypothetical protein
VTSKVTRRMEKLVSKSSLGASDVVRVRQTTPTATAKKVVKASRTTRDFPIPRT